MYLTGGMPNPYDVALRERVVAAYDAGTGAALEVAHLFGVAGLEDLITETPDATCAELCWVYNRHVPRAQRTILTSLWRAMRRTGHVLQQTAAAERNQPARCPRETRDAREMGAPGQPAAARVCR